MTAIVTGKGRNEPLRPGWNGARTMAAGRLLLAVLLAVFATTDPEAVGFQFETDDIAAAGYMCWSLLLFAIAWRSWWLDFVVFPFAYGIDILAFIVIPATLLPTNDLDVVAMLTMATFVLLAAGKRWNWETAAVIAVVLNLVHVVAYLTPANLGLKLAEGGELQRIAYLALVSFLLVRTRRRERNIDIPRFDFNDLSGDHSVLDSAVEYVESVCGTRAAALCWTRAGENECTLAQRGLNQKLVSENPPECIVAEEFKDAPPFLFNAKWRRALMIRPNGEIGMFRRGMKDSSILEEFGIERGGCIRVDGASGHGMLLVGDTKKFDADFLRLLVAVGSEVASGIDRYEYMAVVHEKALANLSQAIARDLHDGAAQALAGARFWLIAMKQMVADRPELIKEIGDIQNALGEEHLYIRDAITRLRRGTNSREHSELADELQSILTAASVQWRIDAKFAGHKRRMHLPTMLVLEIRKIVREAIANCARHGKAQEVELRCNLHEGQLLLTISDNGSGFADNANDHKPQTIMERVYNLGGSLNIRAEAGWTHLEMSLPIGEIK